MAFRSTFTSSDTTVSWPIWFTEKYSNSINFNLRTDSSRGVTSSCLNSKIEEKDGEQLALDVQQAIDWKSFPHLMKFTIVFIHDFSGVIKCDISRETIVWSIVQTWEVTSPDNLFL